MIWVVAGICLLILIPAYAYDRYSKCMQDGELEELRKRYRHYYED